MNPLDHSHRAMLRDDDVRAKQQNQLSSRST